MTARRGVRVSLLSTLALLGAFIAAGPAQAARPGSDTAPVPIPGGIDVPPLIHVFAPGPTELGLMGTDVEPSTITNFNGLAAYAVFTGSATDADGKPYDAVLDMRVFDGAYVAADGSHHRGAFGFIWIDLYEPGTGFTQQVHDFEPGITSSGLFWTMPIPRSAITRHGQSITFKMTNAPTPDFFVFLGDHSVPGTVSFSVTWTATSGVRHLQPGSSDPTDPTNFAAELRDAAPSATFSGSNANGFSFTGSAGPEGNLFSEFGHERNGVFLKS